MEFPAKGSKEDRFPMLCLSDSIRHDDPAVQRLLSVVEEAQTLTQLLLAVAYRRVLCIQHKLLGADHPDVAMSWHNLGVLLHHHGEMAEAQQCLAQPLTICAAPLGADHPHTRLCQENAAMTRPCAVTGRSLRH